MEWLNSSIEKIDRLGSFLFQVKILYFSHSNHYITKLVHGSTPQDTVEISIRLAPQDHICGDIVNGKQIHEKFPNMVWKKPGGKHYFDVDRPRDAISFAYPAERLEDFKKLGLYNGQDSISFFITPRIEQLAAEYRKLCLQLYTPGCADKLDWVCFELYREVLYANEQVQEQQTDVEKIKNISLYLQMHFNESIDLDEIAYKYGFSRTVFFRKWKEVFNITPRQYILEQQLQAATRFLIQTDMPLNMIVQEIHFSGSTAFYHQFHRRFQMSPSEYRKKHNLASSSNLKTLN